jgi:hypothetical protein
MKKPHLTTPEPKASSTWERLENFVREYVQPTLLANKVPCPRRSTSDPCGDGTSSNTPCATKANWLAYDGL